MARDIEIYGINLESFSQEKYKNSPDIISHLYNLDHDKWESHGVVRITDFRSKELCFAISQVVDDLTETGYGFLEGVTIHSEIGINIMVLRKSDILNVVNWLVMTSEAFGELTGNTEDYRHNCSSLYSSALDAAREICNGNEFEWYWFQREMFEEWHSKISSTSFNYYVWVDSY